MTYQAGCKSGQKVRRAQARARQEEMAESDGSGEPDNHRASSLLLPQQQQKKTKKRLARRNKSHSSLGNGTNVYSESPLGQ